MKKAIIIANGDSPTKSQINFLKHKNYRTVICADGGANSARKLNIIPDLIIGDMDSITKNNINFFKGKSEIIKYKRQDDTDVEKAIKYLIRRKYSDVILLGAAGDRLDHTICNLGIVLKFLAKIKVSILYKKSFLVPYKEFVKLTTVPGETISFYGFDNKTNLTVEGVKYPIINRTLPFGEKESTSNIAVKNSVILKIEGGVIFVIRDFKLLKKYDLI